MKRLALGLSLLAAATPAAALETLYLEGPLGLQRLSVNLQELSSPEALWSGTSDLAELNRATDGRLGRSLQTLFTTPLPLPVQLGLDNPMARQVEMLVQSLVEPSEQQRPLPVVQAGATLPWLRQAAASGEPLTLLTLLKVLPGQERTIRLDRALPALRKISAQTAALDQQLLAQTPLPAAPAAALAKGPRATERRVVVLASGLELTVVRPAGAPELPTVLISHGLWDAPVSFLGWAEHLASHGAVVLLPRHSGSDTRQQTSMLAGRSEPPKPEEFLRRPAQLKAVLDALEAGQIPAAAGAPTRDVVLIGHSWGATSTLQLAGARSVEDPLWQACQQANHPSRNPSWVLQCGVLPAAQPESLLDPRLARVVAVSPPQGLVFAGGLNDLALPVLLISGSRDLVVPAQPEAIEPFARYSQGAHRLVVARDGTHFNLPSASGGNGGSLRALLLAWVKGEPIGPDAPVADPAGLTLFQLR